MTITPSTTTHTGIDRLDLAQLPLPETVTMLRGLGRRLFSAALAAAPPPPLPALLADQNDMLGAQWQAHRARRRHRQSIVGGSQPAIVRARIFIARALRRSPADSYERTLADALSGRLAEPAWRARLEDEFERQLGLTVPPFAPDPFWPLLSLAAWNDLSFQHALALELWEYLRPRTLCIPRDIDHAFWSPNTFWALIDLTAPGSLTRRQRWSRNRRLAFDAGQRLRAEARRQALVGEWAGFWDQWILLRARTFWPQDAGSSLLRQAVEALPLSETQPAVREHKAGSPPPLARAGWRGEAPSWYPGLIDYRSR